MINSTSLLAINKSLLLCIFITVIGISLSAIIVWTIYDINPIDTESTKILPTENTKLTPIMEQKIAQIQIPFIKNEGQADSQILYYAQIFAGRVAITSDSIVYDLNSDDTKFVIKESFGNLLYPQGMEKSETDINYFVGAKENWRNHVPAYQNILVQTPWYNIDAKVISHMSNTEKIFTVHPYGNPLDILISVDGPDTLTLSENDELVMHFGQKMTSFTAPVAYQIIDGVKVHVDVSYVVFDRAYGFSVGKYDKEYDLVIDPLVASTFLGGSSADRAYAIAIDSSGIYVAGYTTDDTTDLPVTGGAYDGSHNGNNDVFVSKFNSGLTTLSASTFLGGSGIDVAQAIAIDSSGNIYVAGYTASTDLPVTAGAYDESHNGSYDVFVSKFNSGLTTLSASTFLGGSGNDVAQAIAIDSSGNIYVAGYATSTNFPVTGGAYDGSHNGGNDVFVSKFNSGLTTLSASTFLGGSSSDVAQAIAIDSSGNIYVTGYATSTNFPVTGGAYDESHNGGEDVFVSKFNSGLTTLSASTFLGGSGIDVAQAIAIDSSGNIYVAGHTTDDTTDLPVTGGAYDESHNGSYDVFVSKFSSLDLSSSSTSTEISGSGCADCTPPTLGVDFNSKRMVTNGFSYNANPVDVSLYYTPYPLITANIGHNNTAEFKIYENSGVDKIRHFDFAFGLAKGQILSDSKARIEWDKKWDGTEITTLIDPNNVLQNVTISTQTISCQDTSNDQCLLLIVFHTFRESLEFDIVATNVWDEHRNAWQNYYNHGIHITGESLNPPKQYDGIDKGQIYHLTETGKNKAVDSFGNTWTFSNSWMKDYIPNQRSQDVDWQVMDRTHSDFANLVDGEIIKAQNKLLALCPECSESYDLAPSKSFTYSERINKLDDPEIQKKMAIEADRAQKIMDALLK